MCGVRGGVVLPGGPAACLYPRSLTTHPLAKINAVESVMTRLSFSYYLDYAYFIHLVLPTKHDGGGIDFLEVQMNPVDQFLNFGRFRALLGFFQSGPGRRELAGDPKSKELV
jgi:hypothetical protein